MKVGIAGIGFMGWIHWLAYQRLEGVEVGAICTRDERKLAGDWTGVKGNFGPPGQQVDLTNVACYSQLDALLSDPSIDLIDICLPPNLHADVANRALSAGKHVLCEKPMALNTADCDAMVQAARDAGKQIAIGQVLPFFPEFAYLVKAHQEQRFGRLLGGVFKRVISDPSASWLPDFFNPETVGGPLIDLHVHDAHLIRYLFGMPKAVVSRGRRRGDMVEYCNTLFEFDDPRLVVSAASGVIAQQARAFTHGYEAHFEQATLHFELAFTGGEASSMPLTVMHDDGTHERPDLGGGDDITAFEAEITETLEAIRSGQPSTLLGGDLARDAIVLCYKQHESVLSGEAVAVESS